MGHERIGYLPKSKKWASVIEDISMYSSQEDDTLEISKQTLKNVRYKFEEIINDSGTKSAFEFLILLTLIPKKDNWQAFLNNKGIVLDEKFSLLQIVSNAKNYIEVNEGSKEYSAIASQSLVDSIAQWTNNVKQGNLFSAYDSQSEIWNPAANGSGFCELSRLFFSKFTERYLKYFLQREAYGRIDNLYELNEFNNNIEKHVQQISTHAFETAKITQSYSAAWYNKHVKKTLPSQGEIKSFVSYSFKKINSELLSEQSGG